MVNPSKRKGDSFEWALIAAAQAPDGALAEVGLCVERTRAGYERDYGDVHVLTPDRQLLAALQAKNRREWKISAWLDDAEWQAHRARARWGVLIVKRPRVADVGRSLAVTSVAAHLRLLASLHEAERRARVAEETLAALRAQGVAVPVPAPRLFGPLRAVGDPE